MGTEPIKVNPNISFDSLGGLDHHIKTLREAIVLPLLYPDVFASLGVDAPSGLLFHGPPGTGKTLMAQAVANAASATGTPVAFFMRKGADCLSKWVGEAERQLRALFDAAAAAAPAIIFFDELDGLAPVRSSRQDQIHNSLVSTLLAMMDGASSRGRVVVIGATNRPDAIDPALRRPGRFDRELYFPLPDAQGRKAILAIHTKKLNPPIADSVLTDLARVTPGFGGSDLRALCVEASLAAFRRSYPALYQPPGDEHYMLAPGSVPVVMEDFKSALAVVTPASARRSPPFARALIDKTPDALYLGPYVNFARTSLFSQLPESLLQTGFSLRPASYWALQPQSMFKPSLLVVGSRENDPTRALAALLAELDGVKVYDLSFHSLGQDFTLSDVFHELPRALPAVLLIPDIHVWVQTVPPEVLEAFLALYANIPHASPVILMASSCASQVPDQRVAELFDPGSTVYLVPPTRQDLNRVVASAIEEHVFNVVPGAQLAQELPKPQASASLPPPPLPPSSPSLPMEVVVEKRKVEEEDPVRKKKRAKLQKMEASEEHAHRELRNYLRKILEDVRTVQRLRKFFAGFLKYKGYTEAIPEPLSLNDVEAKVGARAYKSTAAFQADIDKIVNDTHTFFDGRKDASRRDAALELQDIVASRIHRFDIHALGKLLKRIESLRVDLASAPPSPAPPTSSTLSRRVFLSPLPPPRSASSSVASSPSSLSTTGAEKGGGQGWFTHQEKVSLVGLISLTVSNHCGSRPLNLNLLRRIHATITAVGHAHRHSSDKSRIVNDLCKRLPPSSGM